MAVMFCGDSKDSSEKKKKTKTKNWKQAFTDLYSVSL